MAAVVAVPGIVESDQLSGHDTSGPKLCCRCDNGDGDTKKHCIADGLVAKVVILAARN